MDEILIEDKKYVSSKRAAKITGYAKDYIGQLCREGRVPARLVGRSWYVLESAISDHRFGSSKETSTKKEKSPSTQPQSSWEAARYESYEVETTPSISLNKEEDTAEIAQHLQDTWKAWFDRVAENTPSEEREQSVPVITYKEPDVTVEEEVSITIADADTEESVEEQETSIPVHTMMPQGYTEEPLQEERVHRYTNEFRTANRKSFKALRIIGALIALFSVGTAFLGSGYLDEYLSSSNRALIISGVNIYNK